MSINLLHSLDQENIERAKMVYLPHSNKSMKKAQDNGWIVSNTTSAHIANNIEKLNSQLEQGLIVKKSTIKSNAKLDGIPAISFPNIFVQSTFMRLYYNNFDRMSSIPAAKILMDYFKTHAVCHNCGRCSGLCYNNKFEAQYAQKAISELRMLLAYITEPEKLAQKVVRSANRSKSGYFRINANGEIHSDDMLNWWKGICREASTIEFYTYTKSFSLFERHMDSLPSNLHVNMSVIEGQEEQLSKYTKLYSGNKFKMVTSVPENSTTTCTGNCSTCGKLCMRDLPQDNITIYCLYHN